MILTDYHLHCEVSQDSDAPMIDMVRAEAAAGVRHLCFTDHCDMVDWEVYRFNPDCREIPGRSFRKLAELRARQDLPAVELCVGIELGEALFDPAAAAEIAATPGLDFVLGSLHILQDYGDLWRVKFRSEAQCREIMDVYLCELQRIAELDFFDVMAHIGFVYRYMWQQGFHTELSLARYGEKIETLLRTLIDRGRGIEINCSGIRDGCGPFPQPEILRLYRDLGGEIITVGSDAHRPEDAAKCLREGYDFLQHCGFGYVTVFRQRNAEFIKI